MYIVVLIIFAIMGCSQINKEVKDPVLVRALPDLKNVILTGCQWQPTVLLTVDEILQILPKGTTKDQLQNGIAVAEPDITNVCQMAQAVLSDKKS